MRKIRHLLCRCECMVSLFFECIYALIESQMNMANVIHCDDKMKSEQKRNGSREKKERHNNNNLE